MAKLEVIQSQLIHIKKLEANTGQIPWLPANPRTIDDVRLSKLKHSIQKNPEMLCLRELLVYEYKNKYIVVGGNQRLQALEGTAFKEIPCKVIPEHATPDQLRAYLIKDNIEYGQWVDEMLQQDWDVMELDDMGMEDVERLAVDKDQELDSEPPQPVESSVSLSSEVETKTEEVREETEEERKELEEPINVENVTQKQPTELVNMDRFFEKVENWNRTVQQVYISVMVPKESESMAVIISVINNFISTHPGVICKQ